MTPDAGLKHPWIKRNKVHSLFKENEKMTRMPLMQDIVSIMKPLPANKE
jgi:hypothetical protein